MRVFAILVQDARTGLYHAVRSQGEIADADIRHTRLAAVLSELVEGDNLYEIVSRNKPVPGIEMGPECAIRVAINIVEALIFLHGQGIAYRDLKPENIVFDKATLAVKLVDYGGLRKLDTKAEQSGYYGTQIYMPPEMILEQQGKKHPPIGFEVDSWELGMLIMTLSTGVNPGDYRQDGHRDKSRDPQTVKDRLIAYASMDVIEKEDFLDKVMGAGSLPLKSLIIGLTEFEPGNRMTLLDAREQLRQMNKEYD